MGLLSPRRNSENGYREYGDEDVEELRRVKLLRKLDLPIEEIRRIQRDELALAEGLRAHGEALARERANLRQMEALCGEIADVGCPLEALDTQKYLEQMGRMEQEGTRFMNVQKKDRKRQKLTHALIAAAVFIALMGVLVGLFVWLSFTEGAPPIGVTLVLALVPVALIVGVLLALRARIREIEGGEEDAAGQY